MARKQRLSMAGVVRTGVGAVLSLYECTGNFMKEALTAPVAADKPAISLTDPAGHRIMRQRRIEIASGFDRQCAQQGFRLVLSDRDTEAA